MSATGYFGSSIRDLWLKDGDMTVTTLPGLSGQAEVLNGGSSVELALTKAAIRAERAGQRYGMVGDYDPVLRAHCRLDREG